MSHVASHSARAQVHCVVGPRQRTTKIVNASITCEQASVLSAALFWPANKRSTYCIAEQLVFQPGTAEPGGRDGGGWIASKKWRLTKSRVSSAPHLKSLVSSPLPPPPKIVKVFRRTAVRHDPGIFMIAPRVVSLFLMFLCLLTGCM